VVTNVLDYDEVVTTANELAIENQNLIEVYVAERPLPGREDMSTDASVKQGLLDWLISQPAVITFATKFRTALEPLGRSDLIFFTKIIRQIAAKSYRAPEYASHLSRALKRFGN